MNSPRDLSGDPFHKAIGRAGNVPLLGNGTPRADRFDKKYGAVHNRNETARGDILDSEIAEIGELLNHFAQRNGQRRSYDAFQREIEDRFHAIGWAVDVQWYEFEIDGQVIEGALMPKIDIVGRVDRTTFDHDRKVHEITNNLLELPGEEKGRVVKANWADAKTQIEGHKNH